MGYFTLIAGMYGRGKDNLAHQALAQQLRLFSTSAFVDSKGFVVRCGTLGQERRGLSPARCSCWHFLECHLMILCKKNFRFFLSPPIPGAAVDSLWPVHCQMGPAARPGVSVSAALLPLLLACCAAHVPLRCRRRP